MLLFQEDAGALSEGVHAATLDYAVRAGKVDVFHGAHAVRAFTGDKTGVYTFRVDGDEFAGLYVPDEGGAHGVQGAGLAGYHVAVSQTSQGKGAEAVLVAAGEELVPSEDDSGVSAVQQTGGSLDGGFPVFTVEAAAYEVGKQFAVRSAVEQMAEFLQIGLDLGGVHDISVMGQGEGILHAGKKEGLDVLRTAHIGGRITNMPDAVTPGQVFYLLFMEYFFYKASAFVKAEVPIGKDRCDTACLLAPVLKAL